MADALSIRGATVFICRGRRTHMEKLCRFCKVNFTSRACDFETAPGKTCDAEMCSNCAVKIGEDLHRCPDHDAAVKQASLFGPTQETNAAAAEAHARQVLAGKYGPFPLTPLQRELLKELLFHQGAHRAITLRDLMGKLQNVMKALYTEREIKDAMRSLVVDFKVRVGAARSGQAGYYLIASSEEARDTARPYIEEIKSLAQRVRVILDPHDLAEYDGQIRLSEPEKKEAV